MSVSGSNLSVTVMTDSWFGKAPVFPEFEVPDTITLKPVNATVNSTERIQGQTYAAQTQPYFLYPQQSRTVYHSSFDSPM